jgi:hypothetical protein
MRAPRLRVAVVTLGDPRWLHALAEPFNKTPRDRGLAEHCCFLRLSRLGRVKGLTATLQSYILSGAAGYQATVIILDRQVYEAYRRIDRVRRKYAGGVIASGQRITNPITYYSMARFVVVRAADTLDLLHACSMETEGRFGSFGEVFSRVAERLDRPWTMHPRDQPRVKALAHLEVAGGGSAGGRDRWLRGRPDRWAR